MRAAAYRAWVTALNAGRPSEAEALARRLDADHARYMRQHFDRDERDPLLYDFQVNTGRVDLEDVAQAVISLVAHRGGAISAVA